MENEKGAIWLEEFLGNSSVVVLCFKDGSGLENNIGLTKAGVETVVDLLQGWIEYHDERMEELFGQLSSLGGSDD